MLRLPKQYHPDFSLPYKKPNSAVRLKTGHPLAPYVNSIILDGVVMGSADSIAVPQSTNAVKKTLGGSRGFGNASVFASDGWRFPYARPISTGKGDNDPFSVYLFFAQISFSSSDHVKYAERPTSNQIFKITIEDAGASTVIRNAAGGGLINRLPIATLDTTKVLHHICFVKASINDRTIYVDDNVGTTATSSGGTYNDSEVDFLYDPQASGPGDAEGNIFICYTFNTALTQLDYHQLRKNPFSLLEPANDLYYFPTVSAPAGNEFQRIIGSETGMRIAGVGGLAG